VSVHDRFPFVIYYVVRAKEIAVVRSFTARVTRRPGSIGTNACGQQPSAPRAEACSRYIPKQRGTRS